MPPEIYLPHEMVLYQNSKIYLNGIYIEDNDDDMLKVKTIINMEI
jgi:hypothetical protein